MTRRDFIRIATIGPSASALARRAAAASLFVPARSVQLDPTARWRTFEITTRVEVLQSSPTTRVWLPTPLPDAPYQKTLGDTYHAVGGRVVMIETGANDPDILGAEWEDGNPAVLTLTSRVATTGHAVNLATAAVPPPPTMAAFARYLKPTRYIPVDGIVKATADRITRGAGTDLERARAIYEWIVENTFRDPKVAGCGTGDIRFMLETNSLGGTCADINALFVGLARASGIPARDLYGLRVAKSERFRSLGLTSDVATRAQHCRAEVYLAGYGWVPADPADVRKVALEEPPGNLPLRDGRVARARTQLFGAWEMNWIAYNAAHDVALPGSKHAALPYFMYPQAEVAGGRLDPLDPENFRYTITVKEAGEAA